MALPVRKLADVGIDPEPVIARMLADGVIGPDLKPLHPINKVGESRCVGGCPDKAVRVGMNAPLSRLCVGYTGLSRAKFGRQEQGIFER